jgi:hypothetical protein
MNFKNQVCYAIRSSPNFKLYKVDNVVFNSIKDIAIKYNLSKDTAYKYIKKGHFPDGTIIRKIINPRPYYV